MAKKKKLRMRKENRNLLIVLGLLIIYFMFIFGIDPFSTFRYDFDEKAWIENTLESWRGETYDVISTGRTGGLVYVEMIGVGNSLKYYGYITAHNERYLQVNSGVRVLAEAYDIDNPADIKNLNNHELRQLEVKRSEINSISQYELDELLKDYILDYIVILHTPTQTCTYDVEWRTLKYADASSNWYELEKEIVESENCGARWESGFSSRGDDYDVIYRYFNMSPYLSESEIY